MEKVNQRECFFNLGDAKSVDIRANSFARDRDNFQSKTSNATTGVNFIKILCTAFAPVDPKSVHRKILTT